VSGAVPPALDEVPTGTSKSRAARWISRRGSGASARLARLARFGTVGVSGFAVNEAALAAFVSGLGINYLLGAVLATQVSSLWNFALVERWAFRGSEARRSVRHRMGLFFAVNNAALLLRGPILVVLTSGLGMNYLMSNLVSLGVLTLVRFAIADSWIWAGAAAPAVASGAVPPQDAPIEPVPPLDDAIESFPKRWGHVTPGLLPDDR
jgi:putative flippase GtrA